MWMVVSVCVDGRVCCWMVGHLDMEFGLWDAVGIYRGGPGTGAGSRRISGACQEEVSTQQVVGFVCLHACAARSFRVTLEPKATGLTPHDTGWISPRVKEWAREQRKI